MTRDFFNEQAEHWDKMVAEKDASKLEQMVGRLRIKRGDRILDVGAGTGVLLPYLLKKVGGGGEVIALDHAEKMLSKAKAKDFKERIDFLCADVMTLPIESGIIDAVICYSSLPHFPDKAKAMIEIKRVLKKDGWVFVCHTVGSEHINQIHRQIHLVQNDLLPDAIEMTTLLSKAVFTEIQVEDKADSYFASARKTG